MHLLSACRILLVLACRATCADLHFDGTSASQHAFSEESTFLIQIHGFSDSTLDLTNYSTAGNSTSATTKARTPTGGTTSPGVPIYTLPRGEGEDAKAVRQWSLVLANDATDGELASISREFADGQHTKPSSGQMPLVAGSLTEEALNAVLEKHLGRVRFVEEDQYQLKVKDSLANTGTSSAGPERKAKTPVYPWGIQYVEADVCRGKGAGVHVYVLDTGIRITHNEFGGRAFAGVDVAASGTYPGTLTVCSPLSTTCAADFHGHGSHCAGTAGASTYGVADGATLWAMKVLDNSGSGWTTWSILAEQWILSSGNRPAVVSISIQANYNSYAEETSIDNLVADGVTVVVAAGNYNQDACLWNPAWISSAITVAAFGGTSGNSWDRSGYSNWGSCIDAYAPGTNILSTGPWSDTHTYFSTGTSMACPHISGLAARMYEAYPTAGSMTAAARWSLLTATSCTGCVTNDATPSPTVNLVIKALNCSTPNITASPTASPTGSPTPLPTASPTATPTLLPTVSPTPSPTVSPTASPSASPTASPTDSPTGSPTAPPTSPTPAPSWGLVVNNCTVCPDIQIFSDCPGHGPATCASAGTTSPGCEWCPLVNECRVKCTCHDDAPPAYSLFDSCAYSGGVPTQQVLYWPIFLSPSYTSYAPECVCPSWRTPAPTADTTDPTPSPTQEGDPTPAPTIQGQDPTPAPTRWPTPSPTEQTKEPTPSPTPEGQDPTPAPTRWPTPSPTPSCEDACCVGVDPTDPKCCHLWNAGAVSSPADCEAYNGGDFCVWTCPTEHPTPAPTHQGFEPTPYPTPSPTIGVAPTPKFPWEPVATPNPTPISTPSPTFGSAPTPKVRQAKVEGSFQVKVPSADAEAFVSDSSVKAAFQRSIAEQAGVAEAEVVVTLSVVTGAGSSGRGRKVSLAQIRLGSADQAEIQVDYSITVEEETEGSSVQGALATVTAEQFTSSVAAELSGGNAGGTGGTSGFAVQAVAGSSTAPTVNVQVSATGDPHLVNVHGQRFDLMQPGNHTMLWIPRGASPSATLLGVVARAEHIGKACSDMYIVALTIKGQWIAGVPGARRLGDAWDMQYFASKPAQRGSRGAGWNTYGNIRMKVNWGHTAEGVKYINLLVRNLANSGYTVGGLLGEDDHTSASTPMADCQQFLSLLGWSR